MKRYYEITYFNNNYHLIETQVVFCSSIKTLIDYLKDFFEDETIIFHSVKIIVPEPID